MPSSPETPFLSKDWGPPCLACFLSPQFRQLCQTKDPNILPKSGELSALHWSPGESLFRVSSAGQWSIGMGQSEFGECPEVCGGLNSCFLEFLPTLGGVLP